MGIISVYIVNKAGGLIFSHDQQNGNAEVEATFCYPLCLVLEEVDRNIVVKFGEKYGIQGKVFYFMYYRFIHAFTNHSCLKKHKINA